MSTIDRRWSVPFEAPELLVIAAAAFVVYVCVARFGPTWGDPEPEIARQYSGR